MNMKKILILTFAALCLQFIFVTLTPNGVSAIKECDTGGAGVQTEICKTNKTALGGVVKEVINILLFIAGTIAVLMVVIGGIRYVTSDGDSNRASQAKNTILYALIGLVVAISSYAIVNFVLGRI